MILIPITPIPKPRMTRADRWKKRPCVVRYWAFKDALRSYMELEGFDRTIEELDIEFVIPVAKSWSIKKKQSLCGKPHQQRPDLDNLIKAVGDSMMSEDCALWKIKATKRWGTEGKIVIW